MASVTEEVRPRRELASRMTLSFGTPRELVVALHKSNDHARRELRTWMREPMEKLLSALAKRHQLEGDLDNLLLRVLHTTEIYLRTRPLMLFAKMGWQAFRSTLMLQAARLLSQPFGQHPDRAARGPAPLPMSNGYESQAYYQPFEKVGEHLFGGDWYAGLHTDDGALWVILADVTGHGYLAYLLASALPDIWESCWREVTSQCQPTEILERMHAYLEQCLPEGIYLEGLLIRLSHEGDVSVVTAGGSKLLLRRRDSPKTELIKLRGAWLGLVPPTNNEQQTWKLEVGDELLLATDGLFDQLDDRLVERLDKCGSSEETSLFTFCQDLLGEVLQSEAQNDDITMVQLRRRLSATVVGHDSVDSHSA